MKLNALRTWLLRIVVGKPMTLAEREVTESLKALKTLQMSDGRVSVDPSEVIDRAGYLEARRRAAALVRNDTSGHEPGRASSPAPLNSDLPKQH